MSRTKKQEKFALSDLVWVIGYQLTAYIGRTAVDTVAEWLQNGLPEELESRMKAALDVALPIAEVESELTAQDFLIRRRVGLEPYKFPATMLRDADVQTARVVLMEEVKREFLANKSEDLESVGCRLNNWISQAKMPPHTKYKVLLNNDWLSLKLLHVGISEGQQIKWDKGEDWPLWTELIAAVPEMATSRVSLRSARWCLFILSVPTKTPSTNSSSGIALSRALDSTVLSYCDIARSSNRFRCQLLRSTFICPRSAV